MPWTTPKTDFAPGNVLTAAQMNAIGDNLEALYAPIQRLGYQARTTSSTSSQTTFAAASDLFASSITFTADGSSAYRIEFFCGEYTTNAANRYLNLSLSIGGTQTGNVVYGTNLGGLNIGSIFLQRWIVPTSGSKTVNFRHFHDSGATGLVAGDGTSNNRPPMFMAVYGPALT